MFSDHCPGHGSRVLLGPGNITAIHNGDDGVTIDWRCPCGGRGRLAAPRLGRRRTATAATL